MELLRRKIDDYLIEWKENTERMPLIVKKIDRKVVEKLVNKMVVSKEGGVEIQWTFKEIF